MSKAAGLRSQKATMSSQWNRGYSLARWLAAAMKSGEKSTPP